MPTANRFRRRPLSACAAALGGGGAFLQAASQAAAQIVWSGEINHQLVFPTSSKDSATFDFDIPGAYGGKAWLIVNFSEGEGKGEPTSTSLRLVGDGGSVDQDSTADAVSKSLSQYGSALSIGEEIGPDSSYLDANGGYLYKSATSDGEWAAGGRHYLGFRAETAHHSESYYYAWADISLAADAKSATIHSWAYESTLHAPLTAGATTAIPEPALTGTLAALFTFGIALAIRWCRRPT